MNRRLEVRIADVIATIDSKHRESGMDMNERPILDRQVFAFSEEAGEVAGAYRRLYHNARRPGTKQELQHEIADALITLHVLCVRMGLAPEVLMHDKLDIIEARGGR
jgi:NTP pyrophosphatase (non-canonical NTP hydrolase)